MDSTQPTEELVDPSSVSVIGFVGETASSKSPVPPEKKPKKDKPPTKVKKSTTATSSSVDDKFSALDDKWSERFNRLEALLLAKSMEPTFSADVRVTPVHSPPANVACDSEPFFQLTNRPVDTSQRTGPDFSAALQPSASKLTRDTPLHGSSSSERTGPDIIVSQQQSAGKLKHRLKSATQGRTGPDTASQKQKLTGKPIADPHRPSTVSAKSSNQPVNDRPRPFSVTGSVSPTPQKSGQDSISSPESDAESQFSDTPPVDLFVDEGELSEEQEFPEQELPTSEEQAYRETMRGIRPFMG